MSLALRSIFSNVAYRIQYIPAEETPQEDAGTLPATPSSLSITNGMGAVTLRTSVTLLAGDLVEFYASPTNDRTVATRIGLGAINEFVHILPVGETRYYWVRVRRVQPGVDLFGSWLPTSSTDGAVGASLSVATGDLANNAATEIGSVTVNSETYEFPNPTGPQDRIFTAFTYANTTAAAVNVEVSVTGSRSLTTPSGLSGTTDGLSWVALSNVTDSSYVSSTQDYVPAQIQDQPASTTRAFVDSNIFVVSVPAGKTYSFEPRFRIFPVVGSTGLCELETQGFTMRVTAVKR